MERRNILLAEIVARRDDTQAAVLARFFRTGPGEYGEGDMFLGVKVPVTRSVVKQCWSRCTFSDLSQCMFSPFHEVRLAALLTLIRIFKHAENDPALQQKCVDFYLAHLDRINNWDLVDLSCYELLGMWLLDRDRTVLYEFARNGRTIWEQRIGIVSTMQFLRHGQLADTFAIAEILLPHTHDLIHKATGWLLREAGKRDKNALIVFLEANHGAMSRTTLRYAIERFPETERKMWLGKRA